MACGNSGMNATSLEALRDIFISDYSTNSSHLVNITAVNSPDSFYVRPIIYKNYLQSIEVPGKEVKNVTELTLMSPVVFMSKIVHHLIRGEIRSVNHDNTCNIFAQDYGFSEESIRCCDIYNSEHSKDVPPLAVHCKLANCKPLKQEWDTEAINAFIYYLGNEKAKITVLDRFRNMLVVNVINTCPDDIATLMCLTGYSTYGIGFTPAPVPAPKPRDYTYRNLSVNEILHVRLTHSESLECFYVSEINDYKKYMAEKSDLTYFSKICEEISYDDLKADQPVSVFIPNYFVYERGIVKEKVKENNVRVQLVDTGRVIEVRTRDLKPLPDKYFRRPISSLFCSVDKKYILDKLEEYLRPNKEFNVTILELGKDFLKPHIVMINPLGN